MTRSLQILATSLMVIISVTALLAHDEYRIVGKVTKRQGALIAVKTKEGKTVAIDLTKETLYTRNKKKVPAAELKIGSSVVVDALGDSIEELEAVEVRLVPSIPGAPVKQASKPPRTPTAAIALAPFDGTAR